MAASGDQELVFKRQILGDNGLGAIGSGKPDE